MTAIALPERVKVIGGTTLVFPCAKCGAEMTVNFYKGNNTRPVQLPGRVTGHCRLPCGHATVYVLEIDGTYVPGKDHVGYHDVVVAEGAYGHVWRRRYVDGVGTDEELGNAYTIYLDTLTQALWDMYGDGYRAGFADGKAGKAPSTLAIPVTL